MENDRGRDVLLLPYVDDGDASPEGLKILKGRPLVHDVQRMMASAQGLSLYREPGELIELLIITPNREFLEPLKSSSSTSPE